MKLRTAISPLEKSAKATTERNRVILKCPISVPQTPADILSGFRSQLSKQAISTNYLSWVAGAYPLSQWTLVV